MPPVEALPSGLEVAAAVGYALFVWWFATGVLLALVRLHRATHAFVMAAMTGLAGLCFFGLLETRQALTPGAALAGFTYGIVIWGWLEMAFLYGFVTGPRRVALVANTRGWVRFRHAWDVVAFHELAILAVGVVLVWVTWDAPNQTGTWTYLVLWVMRISAKLNLFFGVPNVSDELLPRHLEYLGSYFAKGRINWLFPVAVTAATVWLGVIVHSAMVATDGFHVIGLTLIAALLALAVVEHWFLVLPVQDAALWRWALKTGAAAKAAEPAARPRLEVIVGPVPLAPGLATDSGPVIARERRAEPTKRTA